MSVSNVTIPTTQSFLLVDTRTGPNKVLFLPTASTLQGRYLSIKDYYGNATNSSLTISTTGLDRIDQRGIRCVLGSSFGSVIFLSDGLRSWNLLGLYEGADTATSAALVSANLATGGTISYFGTYKIHTFATVGTATFTVTTSSLVVSYLIVAGGGGGGVGRAGGGGAGGFLTGSLNLPTGSYTITVGAGGANAYNDNQGGDGGSSSITSASIPTLVPNSSAAATFVYTGGLQYWTCPAGVTQVNITLLGAGGGNYADSIYFGPAGGTLSGTLYTVPGSVYTILVGQGGRNEGGWWTNQGQGGYGGGGNGNSAQYGGGAGGGGRSAVYYSSTQILIAGGGGGAGSSYQGGRGGGSTGGSSQNGYTTGGTQSAGGTGAAAGSLDTGGSSGTGAGGGGGYYGGGAGAYGQGGGGGSSYYTTATLNGSNMFVMSVNTQGTAGNGVDTAGANTTGIGHDSDGHGKVSLTYVVTGTSTAIGGGGGGGWTTNAGRNGGSGGGASAASAQPGGSGTGFQGNAGAARLSADVGGGGGGAGATASGSTGGIGLTSMLTGTTTYYAGGGGAGANTGGTPGVAYGGTADVANGTYGGGNGANTAGTHHNYQDGVANTGGGGGGQEGYTGNSGAGGSGIVRIAYETSTTRFSITPTVYLQAATYSGSGTWYDSSPNGFNATIENGTAAKNLAQNGIVLNGATNWVFNNITAGNTWTLCVWYKNTGSPVGGNPCIVTQIYSGGAINICLGYGANVGGSFYNGGWAQGTPISLTATSTWTNYYITWDATNLVTYINGVSQGTTTPGMTDAASTNQYRIGRRWDGADYMVGEIGEVVIFSGTAFTSGQVSADYTFRQRNYWV